MVCLLSCRSGGQLFWELQAAAAFVRWLRSCAGHPLPCCEGALDMCWAVPWLLDAAHAGMRTCGSWAKLILRNPCGEFV